MGWLKHKFLRLSGKTTWYRITMIWSKKEAQFFSSNRWYRNAALCLQQYPEDQWDHELVKFESATAPTKRFF
jgi:hypothetical protein